MDFFESTKVVFQRIEKLEPENVTKIMGFLLLKDDGKLEMIRLAFSPERVLQALIDKIKLELDLFPKPLTIPALEKKPLVSEPPTTFTPASSLPPLPSAALPPQNGLWIPQIPVAQHFTPMAWLGSAAVENGLDQYQFGSYNLDASCYQIQAYYPPMLDLSPPVVPQPSLCLPDLAMQVCNSFRQGYCKYGGSCRFLHVFQMENGDCMVLNPPTTNEILSSGSLKLLEVELIDLLKSRRGIPVSVSSLPILYLDQYGKVLQIEGYQEESRRQGRFVCRMIQLLAQMTSSIRLTNRPHGRQSMILVEDINRYAKFKDEPNEHELQVYLTFPPESIFSEHDVYNYFNNFGPVQEIRIPTQVRRMFGFVTFVHPETAALVLTKTNPHCICGTEVLVKPYQLRRMLVERNFQHQINSDAGIPEAELMLHPTPILSENTKVLGKRQTEEHELLVEIETEAVTDRSMSQASNESSLIEGQSKLQPSDSEGVWSVYFTSEVTDDRMKPCKNNVERSFPDIPFSYEVAHGF